MFNLSSLIGASAERWEGYLWHFVTSVLSRNVAAAWLHPGGGIILNKMLKQGPALDRVFHALADPSRRSIVDQLSRRGSASVSALAEPLPMSLPAVLQHLQVLEDSGLVRTEKVGRVRTCSIDVTALQPAERWIQERRTGWERRLERLGKYLAEETDD
jgi:DNA-binding transcriptional ArsR family regulator